MDNIFFSNFLYQPLSQFEATLYGHSYMNVNFISFKGFFSFFEYIFSGSFLSDFFFFISSIFLVGFSNQDGAFIFNQIVNYNEDTQTPNAFDLELFLTIFSLIFNSWNHLYEYANYNFNLIQISKDEFEFFHTYKVPLTSEVNNVYGDTLTYIVKTKTNFVKNGDNSLEMIGEPKIISIMSSDYAFLFSKPLNNGILGLNLNDVIEYFYVTFSRRILLVDQARGIWFYNYFIEMLPVLLNLMKFLCVIVLYKTLVLLSFFTESTKLPYLPSTHSDSYVLTAFDTSITKFHLVTVFILFYFLLFLVLCFKNPKYYFRNWNVILFGMFDEFLSNTIMQQLGIKRGQKYSVFLKSLFFLVLFGNIFGLIPFSFTITSHLIYTFYLSLSILLGITILALHLQGLNFFNLFVPSGAPAALLVLLVPIEIISYVARCFSLAIRLFANMMSGHTLLNILSGFVIKMAQNGLLLISLLPLLVVIGVAVLEMGIAFLQAYVFLVLVCIYLKDGFDASH